MTYNKNAVIAAALQGHKTAKSPPGRGGLKVGRDDETVELFRRIFDLDGGEKFMLARFAHPRVMDTAFAVKLGRDRGKQHLATARAGRTPQNASDGQTSVRCNIVTHGRPPVSQSAFTTGTLHRLCGGDKTVPWSKFERSAHSRGDLNQTLAGKVKEKSKETWADMKARWARQKDRWAECQRQEKLEKRSRTAAREFLEDCMKP